MYVYIFKQQMFYCSIIIVFVKQYVVITFFLITKLIHMSENL